MLDLEPAGQDAHQASLLDTGAQEGSDETPPEDSEGGPNSESQGASSPGAPTQASVADAVNVEPPAVDETSGSSRPAQDVMTSEDAGDESAKLTCNEEGPLPDAQEEPTRHVPTEAEQPGPDVVPSRLAPRSNAQNLTAESTTAQASRMVIDLTEYA
ncbi:hypothetical protein PR003_g11441 [Phytophthora rubi]|uniref:Uncharacterized protein n=1 Tax=Phytophthora rubi TaxID=129364 RepID=A0A6A4F301_9STRA|nr:hypothetical protein PR001_g15086 [Phytophthora rubi]KAE9338544.1 hypothetical protein PR003_g11441 [Phytophthora rubi]